MLRGWAARCSVDRWYRENHFRHELGGGYGTDAYLYNKNTAAAAHADLPQKKTLAGYIILKALSLSLSLSPSPNRPPASAIGPARGPRLSYRVVCRTCIRLSSPPAPPLRGPLPPVDPPFSKIKSPSPADPCFSRWCHRRRVVVTLYTPPPPPPLLFSFFPCLRFLKFSSAPSGPLTPHPSPPVHE